MGQKAIWNGDRFVFTLAPRRALRQSRQQTMTPDGNLERRLFCIYLGAPSCIAPEQTADDHQDEQEEADARHGPEGNLQRRLRLPPELCGGRVGRRDVACRNRVIKTRRLKNIFIN